MKIILIDNYDSFTYNLAHLLKSLGAEVDVKRNDRFDLQELEVYDKILLSPGPGIPREAGRMPEVIRTYAGRKPILSICLGHQAIGEEERPLPRTAGRDSRGTLPLVGDTQGLPPRLPPSDGYGRNG